MLLTNQPHARLILDDRQKMRLRSLVILWPLLLSPLVGYAVAKMSGPYYDGGVNQNSIVTRFVASVIWAVVLLVGLVITLGVLKEKKKYSSSCVHRFSAPAFTTS